MDLFEFADLQEQEKEKSEVKELRNLLESYALSYDTDIASEKFLRLVIKRMSRHLGDSTRRKIFLSSLYTIRRDTDETTFENVMNTYIHVFGLKCHDWDDYYAARKGYSRQY